MRILMKHWVTLFLVVAVFFLAQRYYTSDQQSTVKSVSQSQIVNDVPVQHINVDVDVPEPVQAKPANVAKETKKEELTGRALVDRLIAEYPVMVFSKSYCPYSMKAKNALNTYAMPSKIYHVLELDQREDGRELQSVLGQVTGASTVPRVFIGGKFVGGGDDIQRLHQAGKLKDMLVAAHAL